MFRVKLPPQLRTPSHFPLVMVIPAGHARRPGLALPRGQFTRLPDGSIRVTFQDAYELRTCLDATHAVRQFPKLRPGR